MIPDTKSKFNPPLLERTYQSRIGLFSAASFGESNDPHHLFIKLGLLR
jgi:hypothetical protein